MIQTEKLSEEELLQAKAFELWQARGCPIGSPDRDWFAARQWFEEKRSVPAVALPSGSDRLPLALSIREDAEPPPSSERVPTKRGVAASSASPATSQSSRSTRRSKGKRAAAR